MPESNQKRDLLLSRVADEFVDRLQHGERPSVTEYVTQNPELADDLRDLLPAMVELEQLKETIDSVDLPPSVTGSLAHWGDLILRREIGRGGMGIVYEAEQVSLGRLVAVKVLAHSAVFNPIQKRRFEREAHAAGRLHHTNIVPVFGVGEHEGLSYYVMQLIDGQPLSELLRSCRDLTATPPGTTDEPRSKGLESKTEPCQRACERPHHSARVFAGCEGNGSELPLGDDRRLGELIAQVADALHHAHQQGVLHRDIKPANLLFDRNGHIWITDFGLAKVTGQLEDTRTGDFVGTVRYMPPEAFAGQRDASGDIYSLGLTLYELLARRPAFDDTDHSQLLRRVTSAEPPRLDKLRRDLPRDLVTIVHKAIERSPAQRYATATELADDLRRWLHDEPILARRPSVPEQLTRWRRHNPGVAALLTLLLLTLVGAASVANIAAWRFNRLAEDRETARRNAIAAERIANGERAIADTARRTAEDHLVEADRQRERAEASLYQAHITQALLHYRANSFEKAVQALYNATPSIRQKDRRGWEWFYLNRLFQCELRKFDGHQSDKKTAWISALAFSPDGQQLAVGARAPNFRSSTPHMRSDLRVYDLASRKCRHDFGGPAGDVFSVRSLRFADNGRSLNATTFDVKGGPEKMTLQCWDLTSGRITNRHESRHDWQLENEGLARWTNNEVVFAHWPSPNSTSESADVTHVEPEATWSITTTEVLAWRAMPDEPGNVLVLCRNGELTIWNSVTQQRLRTVGQLTMPLGGGVPFALFSPDGQIMALRRTRGDSVEFWNTTTAQRLYTYHDPNRAEILTWAFSPDSQTFACGGHSHAIEVLDMQRFEERVVFRNIRAPVSALAFSPDSRQLAGGDWAGTVKVWDINFRPEYATVGSKTWPVDVAWQDHTESPSLVTATIVGTPNGSIQDTVLEAWDVTHSRLQWRRTHPWANPIRLVPGREHMFDAHGQRVLQINRGRISATVVDVQSGQRLAELTGHQNPIHAIALSPDGNRAVTAAIDLSRRESQRKTELKVWDVATGRVLFEHATPGSTLLLTISPDNGLLATASTNWLSQAGSETAQYQLQVWNLETSEELWHVTNRQAALVDFTMRRDSQELATIDRNGLIACWNTQSGQQVSQWRGSDAIESLSYSPDGHRLAGASRADVSLWDPTTGRELLVLPLPASATGSANVPKLRFSPNGDRLAAMHSNGSVFLWNAPQNLGPMASD